MFLYGDFNTLSLLPRKIRLFSLRLLCLPIIASISYEFLKLGAKYENNWFFKILNKPGIWFQKITTKEPDKKQVEVAVKALKAVLK